MFTLKLDRNTVGEDLLRLVDRISNPGNAQKRSVADAIRRGFQDNFSTQGSAAGTPWRALAPSTVIDRQRKGFGGSGPILVRSGRVRSTWVGEGGEHYSSFRQSGGYSVWEEGSDDPIARLHETGTSKMPARPVSLLGDQSERRIIDVLDFMAEQVRSQTIGR
jgi:phage gpG-like protein